MSESCAIKRSHWSMFKLSLNIMAPTPLFQAECFDAPPLQRRLTSTSLRVHERHQPPGTPTQRSQPAQFTFLSWRRVWVLRTLVSGPWRFCCKLCDISLDQIPELIARQKLPKLNHQSNIDPENINNIFTFSPTISGTLRTNTCM